MELRIRDRIFKVTKVTSDEDMEKGLQGVKKLAKDEGMLFEFDEPQTVSFWMKDTEIDLQIIFIDENMEVLDVVQGESGNEEDQFEEDDVKWVLEIAPGFKVKPGDEVCLQMHVLDENGEIQMTIKGGERIFSRKNTKTLVKLSKEADEKQTEVAYKKLGRKMFDYLNTQDSNEDDYVELKKED